MLITDTAAHRLRSARIAEENDKLACRVALKFAGRNAGCPAEDAISEARLKLRQKAGGFDPTWGFQVSTYLWALTWRHLTRWWEVECRRGFVGNGAGTAKLKAYGAEDELADRDTGAPLDGLANGEDQGRLTALVMALPDREREVIRLRFYAGWTLSQIGWHLGISKERARQIEGVALATLKAALTGGESDEV